MSNPHTPGPWTLEHNGAKPGHWLIRHSGPGGHAESVARVYDATNARLIAQAPAMLDTLRAWLDTKWIDGGQCQECEAEADGDTCPNPECLVYQTRAILRAVEGE